MHQSTASFRGTRYSSNSQSRRQYLSNQAPIPQPPSSSHHHHHSHPIPTLIQQQQIQGLQQKIDMILIHNNQLLEQNAQLKKRISLLSIRQVDNRYSVQNQQIYRLNRQLQLKTLQLQQHKSHCHLQKQSQTQQFTQLNLILKQLRQNYQKLLLQKQDMHKQLLYLTTNKQHQIKRIRQEYQNQVYQNSLKKQIEHKDQLREKQYELEKVMENNRKIWEQEKIELEESKMNAIIGLEEKMVKSKEEQMSKIEQQWKEKLKKLQVQADQKCKRIREQSQAYIKTMLQQHNQQQKSDEQLKNQIQGLKLSLQNRQKIIQSLLSHPQYPNTDSTYFSELQHLRNRIKQLTESFFKQTQLLKIKQSIKHEIDIRQTIKVYDNKIDVLSSTITILENDKLQLRQKYQDQIRSKMKQRHRFQIEVSKLKNYIRKMKVELESYGKEMRLNIEGIRDQANSFSMSILGELGQEKNKKNFYQEEIRKMRQVVDLKQHEMDVLMKQSQQKFKYYDQKLKATKQTIQSLSQQLQSKQQKLREQFDRYKETTKQEQRRQKDFHNQQQQQLKKQIVDLRKLTQKLQQRIKQEDIRSQSLQKDLQKALHQIDSHKSHIDALKMELEMLGENQSSQHTAALKQHYERIIKQLEEDKKILKEENAVQEEQISKLIAKYKVLEKSMEKTLSTLKKKTLLENRVMELGMDNNLVKNLAQIFKRSQTSESADRVSGSQRKGSEKQNL